MRLCASIAASVAIAAGTFGCTVKERSQADRDRLLAEDLGSSGSKAGELARLLLDPARDEIARAHAALRLGELPEGASHGEALVQALGDPSTMVRADAATAVGRHGVRSGSSALARLLSADRSEDVRRAAARALGRAADGPAAVEALIAALSDRDPGVVLLALESLEILTGQSHGSNPKAWQDWAAAQPK
jgi:HEAT repeat protein